MMLWKCCTQYASTFVNSAVITGLEKVSFWSYPKEEQSERMFKLPHSSVQSLSHIQLCNPMDCSTPGFPVHHQLLELTQTHVIESMMPSNHLILCRPLLPPSIFPSIRIFSSDSVLRIRWPEYQSFSFNISPSSECSGLISFRMDWLDLLAVQGTLKSLPQHQGSKASFLQCSAFFMAQFSHAYMTTGKTIALTMYRQLLAK